MENEQRWQTISGGGFAVQVEPDATPEIDIQVETPDGVVNMSSDPPEPISALDLMDDPQTSPFYGMVDRLGVLEVPDPLVIERRRLMNKADGLAKVLTDNMGERWSVWRHQMTRVAVVNVVEDCTSLGLSVRRTDDRLTVLIENIETGRGCQITDRGEGGVVVENSEPEGRVSLDEANRLIESGGQHAKLTQEQLILAANELIDVIAEASGLKPEDLPAYARGEKPAPDIVAESKRDPKRRDIERGEKSEFLISLERAMVKGVVTVGLTGLIIGGGQLVKEAYDQYQADQVAHETMVDEAPVAAQFEVRHDTPAADFDLSQPQSAREAERAMSFARPPDEAFFVASNGLAQVLNPETYDTLGAPDAFNPARLFNHVTSGLYRVVPDQPSQSCLTVFGRFGGPDALRTAVFQMDDGAPTGVTIGFRDNRTMEICKPDGGTFDLNETVYVYQETLG